MYEIFFMMKNKISFGLNALQAYDVGKHYRHVMRAETYNPQIFSEIL